VDTSRYTEYRPLMFSIAYRMTGSVSDAEDIVQEAFLRAGKDGDDSGVDEKMKGERSMEYVLGDGEGETWALGEKSVNVEDDLFEDDGPAEGYYSYSRSQNSQRGETNSNSAHYVLFEGETNDMLFHHRRRTSSPPERREGAAPSSSSSASRGSSAASSAACSAASSASCGTSAAFKVNWDHVGEL